MKNFTLLLFALLTVSATYAQEAQLPAKSLIPSLSSEIDLTVSPLVSTTGNKTITERSSTEPRSVTPVYDSVYIWHWNTSNNEWEYYLKDYFAYANNNL
jgi:hypothetical protein